MIESSFAVAPDIQNSAPDKESVERVAALVHDDFGTLDDLPEHLSDIIVALYYEVAAEALRKTAA